MPAMSPTSLVPLDLQVQSLVEAPEADLLYADVEEAIVDDATSGISHMKVSSAPLLPAGAFDLRAALAASIANQKESDAIMATRTAALEQALSQFCPGALLDRSTPADGHCLFHALRRGGVASSEDIPCSLSIRELRSLALSVASEEQLQVAAAGHGDSGLSVAEYKEQMPIGAWGDELMIAMLAKAFCRSISIVSIGMGNWK